MKNDDTGWDAGWDEHSRRQMERMARWPLVKKLEWLEQAHFVALSLAKSRSRKANESEGISDQNPNDT